MDFYLSLNPKHTNVSVWIEYLKKNGDDIYFFNKGEMIPRIGDKCTVYNTNKGEKICQVEVLEIIKKPKYIKICSDLINTKRRTSPQMGLRVRWLKNFNKSSKVVKSDLVGSRLQSSIKIARSELEELIEDYDDYYDEINITDFIRDNIGAFADYQRIRSLVLDILSERYEI